MSRISLAVKSMALLVVLLLTACQQEPNKSSEATAGTPLGLSAQSPIVREPVAGRDITVAYLTIQNQSSEQRVLLGASSPFAKRIEIHEHQHKEGRMRMIKRSSLPIAASADTVLQSGGAHLMLFELQPGKTDRTAENAQLVELTLKFDQGETLTVATQLSSVLD